MNNVVTIFTSILILGYSANAQVRKVEMVPYGGVYQVPCIVNTLPMQFIFDTGASGISLSKEAAQMMVAKGAIRQEDVLGSQYYRIANGDVIEGLVVHLHSFEIAGVRIMDLNATVSLSLNAPLLLGTEVLERFGQVTIDYPNNLILFGESSDPLAEALDNIYLLHEYKWSATSDEIELLEPSEKRRVKLIAGSFSDWKTTNRFNNSVSLQYKNRVKGLVLGKTYEFDEVGLSTEMIEVLQEGLTDGNPDLKYSNMPASTAFIAYKTFNSLILFEGERNPCRLCIGTVYECIRNPISNKSVYGNFFNMSMNPLNLSDLASFQETMIGVLKDARSANWIPADHPVQVIIRRPTIGDDGFYDLCISTSDAASYNVYVVVRRKN